MDLRSAYPFWLLKHGLIRTYPSLQCDTKAEVVIMGGGISGALAAWYLLEAGFDVLVVDRRHIAMGSTAASTSLLQYEIDTPLVKLQQMVGSDRADRSYQLCREAIGKVGEIAKRLHLKEDFRHKPSFQYATFQAHVRELRKEFQAREKAGFKMEWMEERAIMDRYGFRKPAGILSRDGAEINAYDITHALLKQCNRRGVRIYDHTEVKDIRHGKRGVTLQTGDGYHIQARKLIIACGYESQQYIPKKIQQLKSTFVIISEPHPEREFWYRNSLIWETRQPYLYLRTTQDHRIIVGGKDAATSNPVKRDRMLKEKANALEKSFCELFPHIRFKRDFEWAGSFASTKDGLPFIGSIPERSHTSFALGLGGNGITFSIIAAEILRDQLCGRKNNDAAIFSFNR